MREISRRSKYSTGWVRQIIGELKTLKIVFTHGTQSRLGGKVEVFSSGTESVQLPTESVPLTGTNPLQSNNVIKATATEPYSDKREVPTTPITTSTLIADKSLISKHYKPLINFNIDTAWTLAEKLTVARLEQERNIR